MARWIITFLLFSILAGATSVFASVFTRTFFYSPDSEIPVEEAGKPVDPKEEPLRLKIPAIEVDAFVQHVGINKAGNMATPDNFKDVGWYQHGVVPGGRGSSVIAGHVDNGLGLAGVFKNLSDLKAGDDIYIETSGGDQIHFIVTGTRSYPHDDVPTDILFNPAGSIRLNLITCEGKWLAEDKTYDERLVVFARLADE